LKTKVILYESHKEKNMATEQAPTNSVVTKFTNIADNYLTLSEQYAALIKPYAAADVAYKMNSPFYMLTKEVEADLKQLDRESFEKFKAFVSRVEKTPILSEIPKISNKNLLEQAYILMGLISKVRPDYVGPEWIEGIIDQAASGGERRDEKFFAAAQYADKRCGKISREGFNKLVNAMIAEGARNDGGAGFAVACFIDPNSPNTNLYDKQEGNPFSCIDWVTPEQATRIGEVTGNADKGWIGRVKGHIYYQREDLRAFIGDFYDSSLGRKASEEAALRQPHHPGDKVPGEETKANPVIQAAQHRR
jgi:hypothetical protein